MIYACDNCHYLFSETNVVACPDCGRLWSVQQHRQNKKISKIAQTRIYGWTKHRRSFNIRDVAHVEYLYAIPKNAHDSIVMGISHVAFSSISLGVNSGVKPPLLFSQWG